MLARLGVCSLVALALLAVFASGAGAQSREIRARRAALEAARQAREVEALAREHARTTREEKLRRIEETFDAADETGSPDGADPFADLDDPLDEIDGFEDPLDEIDDFDDPLDEIEDDDVTAPTGLAAEPGADVPGVPDPLDPFDDDRYRDDRGSRALDMYRAAERELDAFQPDGPGDLDPTAPLDTKGGDLDLPDAGLDLEPFDEP